MARPERNTSTTRVQLRMGMGVVEQAETEHDSIFCSRRLPGRDDPWWAGGVGAPRPAQALGGCGPPPGQEALAVQHVTAQALLAGLHAGRQALSAASQHPEVLCVALHGLHGLGALRSRHGAVHAGKAGAALFDELPGVALVSRIG